MRTSHRLSIAGLAGILGLAAVSPIALSTWRDTSADSAAVTPGYDYGTVTLASGVPTLVYSTFPGGGLTITPSITNGGANSGFGNGGSGTNVGAGSTGWALSMNGNDWAGGNSTSAIYTPNSIFGIGGSAPKFYGGGVCPTSVPAATSSSSPATVNCPNFGTASAPTITYTFSQPVTDWSMSINDLGGFNTNGNAGVTMFADWVVTSGQTLSLVSGNNNIQVTGGNTIKVIDPPLQGDNNATGTKGVGAGTVKVAGTYSSVTFRLDYHLTNFATDQGFTASGTNPPDWMAIQWSLSPAVVLTYDGNGGTCTTSSTAVPPSTSVTVAGGSGCSRAGYVFAGWSTAASGGTPVSAGSSLTLNADTTLYAVWTPAPAPAPPAPAPAESSTPTPAPAPTRAPAPPPPGPFAVNDSAVTQMNVPVSVNAAANDTYPAGSVFTQTSSPANGMVAWNSNGTYTYTPNPGFVGIDTFTYKVCMPAPYQDRCATATDFITVGEPNPKANPQTQKISPGSTRPVMYAPVGLAKPAAGSNLRPGSVAIAQTGSGKWGNRLEVPGKGTWILKGTQVQFVPAPGFTGQTTIRYRIQDRNGKWAYSTLTAVAPAIPTVVTGGW